MNWEAKGETRWTATISNGFNGIGKIVAMIEKKQVQKPGDSEEKEDKFFLTLHGTNISNFSTLEEAQKAGENLAADVKGQLLKELNS